MSGYQHGMTVRPSATVLTVEEARRRNAALRLELAALTAEHNHLAPKVEAMRADVTAARKKLSRQIRDLETARTQTANIAAHAQHAANTTPLYGGPEGLQAAAGEIEAYESKPGAKLGTVRRGPSHGTSRRYATGCRCDACLAWRERKTAQAVEQNRRRREEFQALKNAAEAA